jgi:branched-chain amino acid transport system permease protein
VDDVIQELIHAVALGGTYALLALGLAMVWSVLGLINFAHGEIMTCAGYAVYYSLVAGLPFGLAAVLGVATGALVALLMERIAFRPLRGASVTSLMLASFALGAILQVLFQNLISGRGLPIPIPEGLSGTIDLGSVEVGVIQLISIVTTIVSLGLLSLFLSRTTTGISMRAAAENFPVTRLMGIRANTVIASAFALSGLLAGIAAVLWVAERGSVDPLMGLVPVVTAFVAIVFGGLNSLSGAVVGGFLLGAIEVGLESHLPDEALPYRGALTLLIVILVLLARPSGLMGGEAGVKV